MTKRGKGLRKPQCSVCGSLSHRIETCSHPLAQRMRALIAENRKLKGAKNQMPCVPGKHVAWNMCECSNERYHLLHPHPPHPTRCPAYLENM